MNSWQMNGSHQDDRFENILARANHFSSFNFHLRSFFPHIYRHVTLWALSQHHLLITKTNFKLPKRDNLFNRTKMEWIENRSLERNAFAQKIRLNRLGKQNCWVFKSQAKILIQFRWQRTILRGGYLQTNEQVICLLFSQVAGLFFISLTRNLDDKLWYEFVFCLQNMQKYGNIIKLKMTKVADMVRPIIAKYPNTTILSLKFVQTK